MRTIFQLSTFVNDANFLVTSSCLCKNAEGAGFPFQVKAMEDGVDDSVDTLHVHKADHRSGAPPYFYKTTLNDIGGPQLLPQMLSEVPNLVHPTALMQSARIDSLDRRSQSGTAIRNDQLQPPAFDTALIKIVKQTFPGQLTLTLAAHESE